MSYQELMQYKDKLEYKKKVLQEVINKKRVAFTTYRKHYLKYREYAEKQDKLTEELISEI